MAEASRTVKDYKCFIIVALAISVIVSVTCVINNIQRTKEIINATNKAICQIDSTYKDLSRENIKAVFAENQKHINSLLDSISDEKLKAKLSEKLIDVQGEVQLSTINKVSTDSVFVATSLVLMQKEVNDLISVHIDKIDNDYGLISLWAAVLTILFLVFSFYSIFSLEATRSELKELLGESQKKITKMLKSADENYTNYKTNIESKISELDKTRDDIIRQIGNSAKSLEDSITSNELSMNSFLAEKGNSFEIFLNQKREEAQLISNIATNINIVEDGVMAKITNLDEMIKTLNQVAKLSEDYTRNFEEYKNKMKEGEDEINKLKKSMNDIEAKINFVKETITNNIYL